MTGRVDRTPQPPIRRATFGEALQLAIQSRRFMVLCCTYFVCGLNLIFINTHLPNYLALCGQDPMLAANALAIIGGVNIVGSWLAGWLGGIYPKHILLGITFLLRSVVIATYFMFPPSEETTLIFAAAMGLIWLGVIPLVSGLVAELLALEPWPPCWACRLSCTRPDQSSARGAVASSSLISARMTSPGGSARRPAGSRAWS
jgi:Na+/melibiose symporter-like transporter